MNICGCPARYSCNEVVPHLGPPTRKRFGFRMLHSRLLRIAAIPPEAPKQPAALPIEVQQA